jgi:hypothetical protein
MYSDHLKPSSRTKDRNNPFFGPARLARSVTTVNGTSPDDLSDAFSSGDQEARVGCQCRRDSVD